MHLTGLLAEWQAPVFNVVIDGYLLVVENIVHVYQVLKRHENGGIDQTLLVKEALHLVVLVVGVGVIVQLGLVEVLFCVPEFVYVGIQVQVLEVVPQPQL